MRKAKTYSSISEYLDDVPDDHFRDSLTEIYRLGKQLVPEAEELFSYGMPCLKVGKRRMYFAAFKNHYSVFPACDLPEMSDFQTSKGTMQFSKSKPIPTHLIEPMVLSYLKPSS